MRAHGTAPRATPRIPARGEEASSAATAVEAAKAESGNFCTACFDGDYPIPMDEQLLNSKLMLEPAGIAGR